MYLHVVFHDHGYEDFRVNGQIELEAILKDIRAWLVGDNFRNTVQQPYCCVFKYDDGKLFAVLNMATVQSINTHE